MMIIWESIKDNHVSGQYDQHKFCIRLNKENKVTGLYYLTNETEKWVPKNKDEEKLESMKIVAELILEEKTLK